VTGEVAIGAYDRIKQHDHRSMDGLRGVKRDAWEGGHRVPFLARWPGRIKPSTESPALIAHLDMPATFAALTGVSLPNDGCLDSVNVLPALLGESQKGREEFIAHNGGTKGPLMVRKGNWKFIQPGGGNYGKAEKVGESKPTPKGLLFDLAIDPAEQDNLADELPHRAKELANLIEEARKAGRTRE
jgi:arylsulfatase A-like enzyme